MPANQRQQTSQSPASPTSKATSKYTNKDGSKFITVPKASTISDSSETSPAMAQPTTKPNGHTPTSPTDTNGAPTVNRKKQKRRQKQAAKLAAEQPLKTQTNGAQNPADVKKQMQDLEARFQNHGLDESYGENGQFDPAEGDQYYSDEDGDGYSGSYGNDGSSANGYPIPASNPGKKSKKKKKTKAAPPGNPNHNHTHMHAHTHSHSHSHTHTRAHTHGAPNGLSHSHVPLPPLAPTTMPRGPGISKEKIWNTSSQEERERIKEFWLSLGEDERKSLVKVEKDAVLKKMKEQQKHSCSCTVCGRKRTAIEEELEVLYDAYYEELEQYANHQGDGGPSPIMPPPRRFGPMSGLQPPNRLPPAFNGQQPSRARIVEQLGDDEDEEAEENYSDEDVDDDDDYSDEEPEEIPRPPYAADFFSFGNSLTVQGGILTVADDLLKNDGKKFIEMMEQLAERRMAREEDAREQYSNPNYGHPPNGAMHPHSHAHNHPPPPPDDEEYDDEDEEEDEYDSQDEDYDEEEMDTMTEEQRMEEGRRMFQIFAARMFEQRVLTAYKEKVAKERQEKLLEELEEENRATLDKKAKKAKDAQKKKDKLAQKKQALAEEKAKREAEKAAEEAALRAAEEKKAEETQAKEKERKEKEELRQKERETKEAKEREAKERREKQERDKREKEARVKAEREAREKQKREELAATQAVLAATQASKRPQAPVPIPVNLQSHPTAMASPHIPVATPAIPKAPTPIKLRTTSQQDSNGSVPQTPQSSALSQNVSPVPTTPLQGSPGPIGPPGKTQPQHQFLHHPQATSPIHSAIKSPPGMPGPFVGMQPMVMGFQPGMPMMAPGFGGRMHHEPMFPHQPFRPLAGPNGMPMHPGLGMHMPQGRGFPLPHGPPGFPQMPNGLGGIGQPFQKDGPPSQSHSRQQSASYEKPFEAPTSAAQAQPIARPAPIGRPSSVVHGHRHENTGSNDVDDLSNHLGSSALLDDSDEPLSSGMNGRRSSAVPNINTRPNFPPVPFGMDPSAFSSPMNSYNTWGGPPNPFGSSSLPGTNYGGGWGPAINNSFAGVAPPTRPSQPRSVAVRLMICRACKNMEGSTPDGFYDLNLIKEQVDHLNPPNEQPVSEKELLDICETEGNTMNGGGSFEIRKDVNSCFIRHENEFPTSHRPVGAPGEIGSPIVGGGGMSRFSGPPPGF
ncbi:hypothetical protein G7Y89_g9387 [Cudoniella acicularis]|uniref:Stress response protein NST1 n=1 Tax=Cudoniella acicularis TaxID=354080 RepID=A0A8H4RHE3_9HELO|nr:hypothetical protein G7Y89_g9387 [Cudoniella acicularis]